MQTLLGLRWKKHNKGQALLNISFWHRSWWKQDIAIDLGTANIMVYVKRRGIVVEEPAVIAVDTLLHRVVAIGKEAYDMLGRTPRNISAYYPLQKGAIVDYDATAYMITYFIHKAIGRPWLFKPNVIISVPASVTNVERRAVIEACMQAGAGKIVVMEETLAAAIGAGLDGANSNGFMVVNIGGGTTNVAILSASGIVFSESLRMGGQAFDEAICQYLEKKKNIIVGRQTAELLKIHIGTVLKEKQQDYVVVRGRSGETGLPVQVDVDSQEIRSALQEHVEAIIKMIVEVLEKAPPELASDIMDHGIVLAGGGMLLHGLERLIADRTGIAAYCCDDPLRCVIQGAGKTLDKMQRLKDSFSEG